MKTNGRRQNLLQNKYQKYLDDDENSRQIEMINMQASNNNGAKYMKLQDEGKQDSLICQSDPYNHLQASKNSQKIFTNKPTVPKASYNFEPNKIVMNGTTYIHKDAIKGIQKGGNKSKKPEMEVLCEQCYSLQMVPANTYAFVCFHCDCVHKCVPKYGIFICGSCQRQVWYPYGTSDLIKCTKCGTINSLPNQQSNQNSSKNQVLQNNQTALRSEQQLASSKDNQKFYTQRYPQL